MPPKGRMGGATGGVEYSSAKKKRMVARRAAEERRWASRQPTGKPFRPDGQAVEVEFDQTSEPPPR